MADPVTMSAVVGGLAAAGTAAATMVQAKTSSDAMNAEAEAGQQRAAIEAQWSERRALEERVTAQHAAAEEMRKGRLAQSRLGAVAGASGAGASDPTIMTLWKGIEGEATQNAAMATASGDQQAAGLNYQSSLDRWSADTNARIKRAGAKGTLIGGMLGAGAQLGQAMTMRYPTAGKSTGTGYGSGR